jgi:hypothetical protein
MANEKGDVAIHEPVPLSELVAKEIAFLHARSKTARLQTGVTRLQMFFYLLIRNHVAFGKVEETLTAVQEVMSKPPPYRFSNEIIAQAAREFAEFALGDEPAIVDALENKQKGPR